MTAKRRACVVESCAAEVGSRTPFCRRHWDTLPGKLRSRISMGVGGKSTAAQSDEINRALRLIGMMA